MLYRFFMICIIACVSNSILAYKSLYFASLTVKDGLSNMYITDIAKDSLGYMWFATGDGLNRYDGHSMEVFYYQGTNNPYSISNNYILSLAADRYKNLWIGTYDGLNYFDSQTKTFMKFFHKEDDSNSLSNNYIRRVRISKKGNIRVATNNGVNLYDPISKTFQRFHTSVGKKASRINDILEKDGQLLIATDSCLYFLDILENKILNSLTLVQPSTISNAICEDEKGRIYVGTNDGLFEIDFAQQKIKRKYTAHADIPLSISDNSIRNICQDTNGNLLLATFNGINILDKERNVFTSFRQISGTDNGLLHFSFHSVFFDALTGTLWAGSWAGGINYVNDNSKEYTEYSIPNIQNENIIGVVGAMVEDDDGIWIGMEGSGLLLYNFRKAQYEHYSIPEKLNYNIQYSIIKCICKSGNILHIGTNGGLVLQFDIQKRVFTRSTQLPSKPAIQSIMEDKYGNLLITNTSNKGLIILSPDGKVTDTFYDSKGHKIDFKNISIIIADKNNSYFLGNYSAGFSHYDFDTKEYEYFDIANYMDGDQFSPGTINSNHMCKDRKGNLWIATSQAGLFCLDIQKKKVIKRYSMDNYVSRNLIEGVVEDNLGNIWFSTLTEIYRIERKKDTIKKFKGFRLDEFAIRSCFYSKNRVYFGGNMGFVGFNADVVHTNNYVPPVVIKAFRINNKIVFPDKHDYLNEETVLKYNESNITIDYAALEFINPGQIEYEYILEGFDKDWIAVGNHQTAQYTNLLAGKYLFKVRAKNEDNVWSDSRHTLSIKVLPPFWKTPEAYTLYFAVFVFMLFLYYRYVKIRTKLINDIIIEKIEKQHATRLHEERINMFTNFSHELRTPLTLIISPLTELLQDTNLTEKARTSLQLMHKNTLRLSLLVNQLMDFRKTESGTMQLRVAEGNFSLFLQEIVLAFSELTRLRGITLEFNSPATEITIWYDRLLMEKVMFNLISNAVKHTPCGGWIKISESIEETENQKLLKVVVADSGKGIPKDKLEAIFTPFYQVADETETGPSTGIGLHLTLGIIELHKGRIWAESELGHGSFFIFTLPMNNVYTKKEIIQEYKDSEDISRYLEINEVEDKETENREDNKTATILVVDDNKDIRSYIRSSLENIYYVIEAVDGEEAFDLAIENMPTLILSDIMMPRLDGIQLCRKLKQDLRIGHIPVILLTARTTITQIEEGLNIGADDYVTKPFNIRHLKARIKNLIESRGKLKELFKKNYMSFDIDTKIASADDHFIERLYAVINDNLSNTEFDMTGFCREIGMSRTNLYEKIKALTDLSPTEFIRLSRLKAAAKLLKTDNVPISEISLITGFKNHSYFTRSFKAVYGVSPSEYAKQFR